MILKRYFEVWGGFKKFIWGQGSFTVVVNFNVRVGYVYPMLHLWEFCEDTKTLVNS